MSESVIYPTVNLYLYDLLQGLGESESSSSAGVTPPIVGTGDPTEHRAQNFYRKIYGDRVDKDLARVRSRELANSHFTELHPQQIEPFGDPADGYYYPVQLDDTYALFVDYSGKRQGGKENFDPQDLATNPFGDRHQEIVKRLHGGTFTLGQTWVLRATLTSPDLDSEAIARICYSQTFPNTDPNNKWDWDTDYLGRGKLLGGEIYELWRYPRAINDPTDAIGSSQHVLIWLFPHTESDQIALNARIANTYGDWLRLFHYRHKIWAAYAQSQSIAANLKSEVVKIYQIGDRAESALSTLIQSQSSQIVKSASSQIVKHQLDELQTSSLHTLQQFKTYTEGSINLADQGRTIATNCDNYRDRLKAMTDRYPNSDLKFLKEFNGDNHANRYARQIAADDAFLAPRLTYLEKLFQAIDNTVKIVQAKSSVEQAESSVEQTKLARFNSEMIAVVGVGLSVTQVATGTIGAQPPEPGQSKESIASTAPFYGLLWGVAASLVAAFIIQRLNRRR
jgi:hypothetical protein